MKIATWNVNGIRARQGELQEFLATEQPDVLCLQEIKALPEQVPGLLVAPDGYWCYWHGGRGYSGVALLVRRGLCPSAPGFTHPHFDLEQRIVVADLGSMCVASVYVPNGGKDYNAKIRFLQALVDWCGGLCSPSKASSERAAASEPPERSGAPGSPRATAQGGPGDNVPRLSERAAASEPPERSGAPGSPRATAQGGPGDNVPRLILCGDLNVAREERDVHPKLRKADQIGTRPEERALLNRLLESGLRDVGRALDPDNDSLFTWWAPWRNLRQRNIGWRIDYVLAAEPLASRARTAAAMREFGTSDHAPVVVEWGDSDL